MGDIVAKRDETRRQWLNRPQRWTIPAVILGLAAAAAEWSYLLHIRPLQADRGLQISAVLLLGWAVLAAMSFAREERNAWWSLAPAPVALVGPALLVMLVVACGINDASCL